MEFRNTFAALLLGATSALALSSAASAADAVAVEAPAAGFNWSGIYVGFGGGVGAAVHGFDLGGFLDLDGVGGDGVFGEISVGYDRMVTERLLVGVLADARFGNLGPAPFLFSPDAQLEAKYGFDAGLRLGYLVTPETLGYVTGGYSWQRFELSESGSEADWNSSGYFVGAGLETVLSGNWTLKSEYRYSDYGTADPLNSGGALKFDASTHTFAVGVNYRFGAQNGAQSSFETPAYKWTGLYVGGALGAGAMIETGDALSFMPLSGQGVFGEVSVGYDHEFGSIWVAGLMVDARYSGVKGTFAIGGDEMSLSADYGFDVLGRVGAKLSDTTLAYALAGYSWQHLDLDVPAATPLPAGSYRESSHGFSIGGGIETALTDKTAVNLEYRYSKYDSEDFGTAGMIDFEPAFHTVRVGAKYKFN